MARLAEGGRFIVMGVPEVLDKATRRLVRDVQPGGFILFGRNIGLPENPGRPERLRAFIADLRSLVDHEPVVCVDQEGGRVSRLRGLRGGAEAPFAADLARAGKPPLIARHGALTGKLLRLFGFNLDLCPVVDVCRDASADNSLGSRCWGSTPEEVTRKAGAFDRALRKEGVLSCAKHFPGYGPAKVDPHRELPVIETPRETLALDWAPYKALETEFVMTGHALYPGIDGSGLPSSLSRRVITDLLRGELGFRGCVMSDDLDMGAITRHIGLKEAARLAVEAGTDQILICHDLERVREAAESIAGLPKAARAPGLKRLAALQRKLKGPRRWSASEFSKLAGATRKLRAEVLGQDAPPFSPGVGAMSPVEKSKLSAVHFVGDTKAGAPEEYRRRR
ncbi:MAG TPA: glycoside hydrolase family 3 N-terminal domain-containing protein [Elusimicrobiota bacterium]|nr:glycoside hydrolase family 3 N-terminal domain-containing protein [Elusimicrobiota bacterium]